MYAITGFARIVLTPSVKMMKLIEYLENVNETKKDEKGNVIL